VRETGWLATTTTTTTTKHETSNISEQLTAAFVAWKGADRQIWRMASHLSSGKSTTGATCWMPALLARMSRRANSASTPLTMAAHSAGLDTSAPEKPTRTPNSSARAAVADRAVAAGTRPCMTTSGGVVIGIWKRHERSEGAR